MKLNAIFVIILNSVLISTAAMAQTKAPEPDFTLSYNVGVVSDYRFRGIAQTSTDPALQAGVDFAHKSGFYLGAWGSNIRWIKDYAGATDGSLEIIKKYSKNVVFNGRVFSSYHSIGIFYKLLL